MSQKYFLILIIKVILLSSCSKKNNDYDNGLAVVKINFAGTQAINIKKPTQRQLSTSIQYKAASSVNIIQQIEVPINKKHKIVATLTDEVLHTAELNNSKLASNKKTNKIQAAGQVESDLPTGTKYRMLVYDASGAFIEYKDYAVGTPLTSDDSFKLPTGQSYTFVAYSVGTSSISDLDAIMPSGKFNNAKFKNVNGNQHFMYYIKPASTYPHGLTTLNIILKHQFSQIKTIINLENQVNGTISEIDALIRPHLNSVDIDVDSSIPDYDNGSISTSGAPVNFVNYNGDRGAEATTIITAPDQTPSNGATLLITSITIDGETSTHIPPVTGLKIVPGGRYTLTLNVKEFTPDGDIDIDYGYAKWALGNLKYDSNTGTYSFAETSGDYGDYWFPGYDLPKRLDIANPNPSNPGNVNGQAGDPCKKVFPFGAWRLPTDTEYRSIVNTSNIPFPPLRYIGLYNGPETNVGMFLDTDTHPGVNYKDYLFFPYGGSYNDNAFSVTQLGHTGYYLATSSTNTNIYKLMQFGNNINTAEIAASIDYNSAMQIRCVRNKH